jgi:hypothetical protein
MNHCRVLAEYRVLSGIGQIIIDVDIERLLLSRYCLIKDSCIPDPVLNFLVIPTSQVPGMPD